ncbi:DUF6398 domain-containing protein [Paenibacillus thalictri]|uniref:DUF6398 domain-containing protein n=1 Tax=Paenibacillus thalictri TaxID=2527873 RepID=A0A4Q9DW94_9BACL|nr:DUF6398 domain-containing protein [Paenibacillus thalictri]TBL80092.1 hypothetical protein EYB31_06600 [Paenibacillus thalictri]
MWVMLEVCVKLVHVRLFSLLVPFFRSYDYLPEEKVVRILNVMTNHPDNPLESGRIKVWAAAVAHVAMNYDDQYRRRALYQSDFISEHFGISPITLNKKSSYVSKLMNETQ